MNNNLPSFESARVLVVGDLMLDRYWYGSTSSISSEAPAPVVRVGDEEERPGGTGKRGLCGSISEDTPERLICKLLPDLLVRVVITARKISPEPVVWLIMAAR